MSPSPGDLSAFSMLDLFRAEAETQAAILTGGLLELERGERGAQCFELLMRAAHSFKGAARIVNLRPAERIAHALEDCFVASQGGRLVLRRQEIDLFLRAVDLLGQLAKRPDANFAEWEKESATEVAEMTQALEGVVSALPPAATLPTPSIGSGRPQMTAQAALPRPEPLQRTETGERVLRLGAESLNRLLGLAGESLIESRWLRPFADSLDQLKRHHMDLAQQLEHLRVSWKETRPNEAAEGPFQSVLQNLAECRRILGDRMQELEVFDRRSSQLSQRLYLEVLRTRMRPFSDGVRRFPRMVRDMARALDKDIRLEIYGENTAVDRDILERLETPLAHLLRNAVDHGCEPRGVRLAAGKPLECVVRLEARHSAGVLLVTVSDDGGGVNLEQLRKTVIKKGLATPSGAKKLSEAELLEYLFLPGFSLKEAITEISGRGFGLDVVQNMVKSVRGGIRLSQQPGRGLRVQLQLPLTLSVLRALLVGIAGEPYAIPLAQINRSLSLPRASLKMLEGRYHFHCAGQEVGLVAAHQVLGCAPAKLAGDELAIVVLGDRNTSCGLVVDRFLGERELVVQPLDMRLGKIRNISAAALMEDGAPILILDVEETLHSLDKLLAESSGQGLRDRDFLTFGRAKRVLAVDDSLTMRELERHLLSGRGYQADVAADGLEAWNALSSGVYDLVITDLDMPRMDGLELASRIKQDPRLKSVPVLILSYKDRPEDRLRALEAGADYYLEKASFQNQDILVQAVVDLIGVPGE